MLYSKQQEQLLNLPISGNTYLTGGFGTGKTTVAIKRILDIVSSGIQPSSILVLLPQRTLSDPYTIALGKDKNYLSKQITLITMGGLARRMVSLYWPIIGDLTGFRNPNKPPSFLTMESAQYFMARLVSPLFDKGFFSSVSLERNRIYSQILDNLNKSAISGFSHEEIGARLKSAWIGDSSQINIYDNVQECVNLFRKFCHENNLLDYSLQVEIFRNLIWKSKFFQQNLYSTYSYLIYDNCEEDPLFSHQLVQDWLPHLKSALIIQDQGGGYRKFLGADPNSASALSECCEIKFEFSQSFINDENLQTLSHSFFSNTAISHPKKNIDFKNSIHTTLKIPDETLQFYPQMLDWTVARVKEKILEGTNPNQIVILAPFMSDMQRFSIANRLENNGIPYRSNRPSRALRDEPAVQCLLTLATLAHPEWNMIPHKFKLAYALMVAIQDMDLVRARILVDNLLKPEKTPDYLLPFNSLPGLLRDRVSYRFGASYERLRQWLLDTPDEDNLDGFLGRLFGEVLSQPGFRFHHDLDSGRFTAVLIESIKKFRLSIANTESDSNYQIGKEYLQMISEGVIAAQYLEKPDENKEAVTISPAYTFLIQNHAVDYQFWLDISSPAWYERLEQPLTHPHVLSQNWHQDDKWTAEDELRHNQETLEQVVLGLISRCKKSIYLCFSNLNENGSENRGLLLRKIQDLLVRIKND